MSSQDDSRSASNDISRLLKPEGSLPSSQEHVSEINSEPDKFGIRYSHSGSYEEYYLLGESIV
jgi:hypothetical protein